MRGRGEEGVLTGCYAFRFEAVADPGLGEYVGWRACCAFNFFAELADEDPQILRLFGTAGAPYSRQNLAMGGDSVRMTG